MSLNTSSCCSLTEGQLEEVEGVGGVGDCCLLNRPSCILARASELGLGGTGGGGERVFFLPNLASLLGLLGLTGAAAASSSASATASTTNL